MKKFLLAIIMTGSIGLLSSCASTISGDEPAVGSDESTAVPKEKTQGSQRAASTAATTAVAPLTQ